MRTDLLPYGASTYSKSRVAYGDDFPLYATHGMDYRLFDTEGRDYVDMGMGLGSSILGYCNPHVDDAIRRQLNSGLTFSLGHPIELEAAERLLAHFPPGCMVQWGVNGSDATTGAVRLARAATGKNIIAMADDGYHGFHDWCLADSPRSFGINDHDSVFRLKDLCFLDSADARCYVAGFIIEPDLHHDWLKPIREWCTKHGALMISDEVMTWQRYPEWTASAHYGVTPDLWCLGKSLANGMPVSAIVGDSSTLKRFAPPSPNAFFSSTWAGHPLSLAAVIATLDVMEKENGPQKIWDKAQELRRQLLEVRPGGDLVSHNSGPPFNRIQFARPLVAKAWRKLMAEAGCLIYAAHNLSLAHDNNAMKRLLTAWEYAAKHLPECIANAKDDDTSSGIMRR